jgi:hypothetical protein
VRKLIGVTAMTLLVATFGVAGAAAAVEPGEGAPPDPGCNFSVLPQTPDGQVPPGATEVSIVVSGTIGGEFDGAEVSLVLNGVVGTAQPVDATGGFSFGPLTIPVPSDVSVSYSYGNENFYTNFCLGPGGTSVVRVVAGAVAARGPLAFTGSSGTASNVLIALAAIALGTVLVVATRRRSRVKV